MAESLQAWAPRTADALREVPQTTREALVESHRRWVTAARRYAPRDRGDLVRAIDGAVSSDSEGVAATLTIPVEYIAVEEGAEIRPRRGRELAVPITPAAKLLPGPRSDVAGLFVLVARDGRRFLASRTGGGIDLRWRLVPSVRIRGQGFVARAQRDAAEALPGVLLDALEGSV